MKGHTLTAHTECLGIVYVDRDVMCACLGIDFQLGGLKTF